MPRPRRRTERTPKEVISLTHSGDARRNIPTAEMEPVLPEEQRQPIHLAYERRNRDLDPQLVWRGKDEQDADGILTVAAPPLFTQEKVHPKVLVDDLMRLSRRGQPDGATQLDLFADFNGLHDPDARTEFYQHDQNWANRMILGDSLQVMASLAQREGLRGKVQCIYIDPPYGVKFNSNFQWSTTSRDVRDGNSAHITREPEQVKAFRDTWSDGIHSYLTYLRDRLTVARDLLADSGSIFVQIGDENVHRVRALMDEVFGEDNFCSLISYKTSVGLGSQGLDNTANYLVWYCKNKEVRKFRPILRQTIPGEEGASRYKTVWLPDLTEYRVEDPASEALTSGARLFRDQGMTSRTGSATTTFDVLFRGKNYRPTSGGWRTGESGFSRVLRADRIMPTGNTLSFKKFFDDFSAISVDNIWADVSVGVTSRSDPKVYAVQTGTNIIQRCILMTTDPGDLVLDPTCGSGTTAYVAEQWGRRWITIDTSRVALALARARVMGARYPYYLLADSSEGQRKEAEIRRREITEAPTYGDLRQGFVYERVPHITLRDIANNSEIDVIYDGFQETLEPLRDALNRALAREYEEWEIPREARDPWPDSAAVEWRIATGSQNDESDRLNALRILNQELDREYTLDEVPDHPSDPWDPEAAELHRQWWEARIDRQREIDASIAANANFEYLYDKPYEDRSKTRVAGPFTVESLSPHRVMPSGDIGQRAIAETGDGYRHNGDLPERDFGAMILENLRASGVQQSSKQDKIDFTSLTGWPGHYVCADGRFAEGADDTAIERRAAIFIGPEFGTVQRADLTAAAREAAEAGFDLLIACAFSYDAHAVELTSIGALPVLKARMNADLHMADTLKNDSRGNLFVIFGEPDIETLGAGTDAEGHELVQVKVNGVDIFDPSTGQVRSDDTDGIACWFVDTDYNEESFFVRQAYFLGASNDPYKALKTTLKAEIDEEAWATLRSDTSRAFPKPESGRIAVKVINHLGDEAMKVLRV